MEQSLNYSWGFIHGFENDYIHGLPKEVENVDIPHSVKTLPAHYISEDEFQGIYTYEKRFICEKHEFAFLRFAGVMLQFDAYLNGEHLGHYVSGYFPVKLDVSKQIQEGENLLIVKVDTREDPLIPPFGNIVDYLTYGGIYRSVSLETHDGPFIEDMFIEANSSGDLSVKHWVKGTSEMVHRLYEGDTLISEFKTDKTHIDNVKIWSVENPFLYTLISKYGNHEVKHLVGFRDIQFTEHGFFLNGKPFKIIGLNRHQTYPYFGAAAPSALQQEDAWILKNQIGINTVRTSHYADDESFLDECDRLGLLVIDEIPGWQFISNEPNWRGICKDNSKRLVIKERNHPCLIAYGLRIDESKDDHELYSDIIRIKNKYDPNRPCLGVRNMRDSECLEDVYAYNDFSCQNTKHGLVDLSLWKGAKGKPKLVSENNGHMFPTKSFDTEERRIEQALRHARVLDDAFKMTDLCGCIGWCAFDYGTHRQFGSGDHICYHGVADIYRNNKYAAYVYGSQCKKDTFFVASIFRNGEFDESLLPSIYVFTDADYVKLYVGKEEVGDFYPDKKNYPHLPHAPILVDDFIGKRFHEDEFKGKDAKRIIEALNEVGHVGMPKMSNKTKRTMLLIALKHHKSFKDVSSLYMKYINDAFITDEPVTFIGYKDGKEFARKTFENYGRTKLVAAPFKTTLSNDFDYDATSISLIATDKHGNQAPFANEVIHVEVEGPIQVMGPTAFALEGGSSRLYVRSVAKPNEKGAATVRIIGQNETIEIPFYVS